MSFRAALAKSLGFALAADVAATPAAGTTSIQLPVRQAVTVDPNTALTLGTVYRGIQIHATSAAQLTFNVDRNGDRIPTPPLAVKPCLEMSLAAFNEFNTVAMYTAGEVFWRIIRAGADARIPGEVVNVVPINPAEVGVSVHRDGPDTYQWRGQEYTERDMRHLKLLRIPGHSRGLGPIQAANKEIRGSLEARDYGASWLTESGTPDGVLTSDQVLNGEVAQLVKDKWYGKTADGKDLPDHDPRRLKVLGSGLKYNPILLKPADVQFLESQQFNTTQIARLLGIPASLMLAAVEGNSQTYSNVEQEWLAYIRFSLMLSLKEVEDHLTALLPRGQRARFNLEALLRSDTKTRYEAHRLADWLTDDEKRAIEGYAPLTPEQRQQISTRKATPNVTK